ncbi:protein MIF2 [Kluyveromyces marxianus DMKU3-1042]|uniref:CENP-C homolog n=1 Tax=Kluyveromyces marxianus (strain DMKU3-1042 / BCC 29191 / NBRC 104275) TaxID=1003335 RepID=W0T6W5_KLUMD|nr:protein MIF2 [Kluyveromyces marxianus DMKU3-1042]BAO39352.1 protein MIF2 [Kluyveromyces marxianus DMKU3-1042]
MDYMNLGVRSRKTGLTVDKLVPKDEYSMENIDDFFKEGDKTGPGLGPGPASTRTRPGHGPGQALDPRTTSGPGQGPGQSSFDAFKIPSTVPEPGTSPAPGTPENQTSDQWFPDVNEMPEVPHDSPGTPGSPGTPQKRFIREQDVDSYDSPDSDPSIRLTPEQDYRDVPDLVDDGETTRDTSLSEEHVLLEDELDDDFRPETDIDTEYRDGSTDGSTDDTSDDTSDDDSDHPEDSDSDHPEDSDSDSSLIQAQAKELLQNEKPTASATGGVRRSTRIRVAPLEFWRNEKVVYKRSSNKPVLEIDKIITYDHDQDEEEEQFLKNNKRSKTQAQGQAQAQAKTKSRPYNYIPSGRPRGRPRKNKPPEQEEGEKSGNARILQEIKNGTYPNAQWLQHGVYQSTVNVSADEKKDQDILAFAPGLAQAEQVTSSNNDKFTLAILFDKHKERFASGILKIPVDGAKTLANAHNAFINFYVIQGIVEVTVENKKFICTKGSSFQIPAFNNYGFTNKGMDNADLYFVQVTVPETFDGSQEPGSEADDTSDKSSSNMSLTTT